MKSTKKQQRRVYKAFTLITQVGINMVVCIGVSIFIGMFLDSRLETSPLFLIIFIIFGIGAAFKNMYRLCMNVFKD